MPTIEELEQRADELRDAEAAALNALGEGMRELAVLLPDGSRLAVDFARLARTLDLFATVSSPGPWGEVSIRQTLNAYYGDFEAAYFRGLCGKDGDD